VLLADVRPGHTVALRDVAKGDLATLYEIQRDPESHRMAAFGAADPSDRDAFVARARRILADPGNLWMVVVLDGQVVGSVSRFDLFGVPSVAYEVARSLWGRGIGTRALAELLRLVPTRPLFARVAADNVASRRVLEKCGFLDVGGERSFANARGAEIEERIYRCDAPGA